MAIDQTTLKEFDAYLTGKLNNQDSLAFELKIATDAQLKSEFELYCSIEESIHFNKKAQLKSYILKNAATELTGNIWGKVWTRISAIFILLIGILIFFSEYNSKKTDPLEKADSNQINQTIVDSTQLNQPKK